jgi:N-methylhydantoinase B
MPHDSPDGGLHYVVSGKGVDFPMSDGLSGGYPGAPNDYVWVHNDRIGDERKNVDFRFARSLDELPGEKETVPWGVYPLMGQDALYVRWNGGGGYGDPLDRDSAAVRRDVVEGVVSADAARDVYGVVLSGAEVDAAATADRRRTMAADRMAPEAAE